MKHSRHVNPAAGRNGADDAAGDHTGADQAADDYAADDYAAAGAPRFRAHSGAGGSPATAPTSSPYQAGEYLTEDEWRARRRPELVEDIVDRMMARVSGGRAVPAVLLAEAWSDVVGESFAARTRPGSCESGRLVILVADGATASKMRFQTSQIMQKATEIAGEGRVSSIAFRVSKDLRQ